ncbi:MAG: SufS family cysteine desulfurase [Candidatus Buchananbacteria bacterium]|nr:SufS family cysteine desulfurase [Candidatus Buchananbacteria bacterium]
MDYKKDFPIFKKLDSKTKPFVYLDSAATSQKPKVVIDSMVDFYSSKNANIHRGAYDLAQNATVNFENARKVVAEFINAADASSIVFTKGTTEGTNLVAASWAKNNLKKGDVILATEMEHHANIVPWQMLAKEKQLQLRYWPITADGHLQKLTPALLRKVKLIAVTQVSNVLGTINQVQQIASLARKKKIPILIDAAQSVSHCLVDIKKINPDFLVFSGHKMLGPTGIGVLYVAPHRFKEMQPYQAGGDMIETVDWQQSKFKEMPWLLEAGTQPLAQVAGLVAAIKYLQKIGPKKIISHGTALTKHAYQELKKIKEVEIYGPVPKDRLGLVAFNVVDLHPHDLATWLNDYGIAIRVGHHCAEPLHEKLGIPASARISFHLYNDKSEIDYFIKSLKEIIKKWQSFIKN